VEQDTLWWFLNRAPAEGVKLSRLKEIQKMCSEVNIATSFPWLMKRQSRLLSPAEFWARIYSGQGCYPMEGEGVDTALGYSLGLDIAGRLSERLVNPERAGESEIYISFSLPKHRIVKMECVSDCFDEDLMDEAIEIVRGFHHSWAVRFSVYEALTEPDCYLGSVLVAPDGTYFLEGQN
jgi:hypothetical protein